MFHLSPELVAAIGAGDIVFVIERTEKGDMIRETTEIKSTHDVKSMLDTITDGFERIDEFMNTKVQGDDTSKPQGIAIVCQGDKDNPGNPFLSFIEIEDNATGQSIEIGEWVDGEDGKRILLINADDFRAIHAGADFEIAGVRVGTTEDGQFLLPMHEYNACMLAIMMCRDITVPQSWSIETRDRFVDRSKMIVDCYDNPQTTFQPTDQYWVPGVLYGWGGTKSLIYQGNVYTKADAVAEPGKPDNPAVPELKPWEPKPGAWGRSIKDIHERVEAECKSAEERIKTFEGMHFDIGYFNGVENIRAFMEMREGNFKEVVARQPAKRFIDDDGKSRSTQPVKAEPISVFEFNTLELVDELAARLRNRMDYDGGPFTKRDDVKAILTSLSDLRMITAGNKLLQQPTTAR